MDRYDNVAFGYTVVAQPVPPGQTIGLSFFDQTNASTPTGGSADANGYGWRLAWNNNLCDTRSTRIGAGARPSSASAHMRIDVTTGVKWFAFAAAKVF